MPIPLLILDLFDPALASVGLEGGSSNGGQLWAGDGAPVPWCLPGEMSTSLCSVEKSWFKSQQPQPLPSSPVPAEGMLLARLPPHLCSMCQDFPPSPEAWKPLQTSSTVVYGFMFFLGNTTVL